MRVKGFCPVTKKEEFIDFDAMPCGDFESADCHVKGLMNSCSVGDYRFRPCTAERPIYKSFPENFRIPKNRNN